MTTPDPRRGDGPGDPGTTPGQPNPGDPNAPRDAKPDDGSESLDVRDEPPAGQDAA